MEEIALQSENHTIIINYGWKVNIQENVERKKLLIYIYSHSTYILAVAWAVEQQTPDKPERGDGLTCFCDQAMQI